MSDKEVTEKTISFFFGGNPFIFIAYLTFLFENHFET